MAKAEALRGVMKNLGIIGGLTVVSSTGAVIGKLQVRQDIFGKFLNVLPCLLAALTLSSGGFRTVAKNFGFPLPALSGFLAVVCNGVGSLLVLLGAIAPGYARGCIPWSAALSIPGSLMLIAFLGIATIVGELKNMCSAEGDDREGFAQGVFTSLGIIGGLIFIVALELQKISTAC